MFSDILTPLSGMGIEWDVVKGIGLLIAEPARSIKQVEMIEREMFEPEESSWFVRKVLQGLEKEIGNRSAVLGFISAPFTMAAYLVEGMSAKYCKENKGMVVEKSERGDEMGGRECLRRLLEVLSERLIRHARF